MYTICMDLMGPLQTAGSGKANRKEPTYLLAMVDPFSHRIWLEPIYSKHAEQVYDGFIRKILLEWGGSTSVGSRNRFSTSLYSAARPGTPAEPSDTARAPGDGAPPRGVVEVVHVLLK